MLVNGVDIIEIHRIKGVADRYGRRFLRRIYTDGEIAYCRGRAPQLASRFAAKEAVLKALGTGWRDGIAWTDIEVRRDPAGAPSIRLSGEAQRIAESKGITGWLVSISHTASLAQASVIGTGNATG